MRLRCSEVRSVFLLTVLILPIGDAWAQAQTTVQAPGSGARELFVTTGKSLVVESPVEIRRVAVANANVAEAVAVAPREILVNGKTPGETSLVVWQQGGNRILFDLRVKPSTLQLEAVRRQLSDTLPGEPVSLTIEDGNVFVRGTASDMIAAERAITIAGTLGKPVNLLNVKVPPVAEQVLLKVRFADVDRAAVSELGVNLFSTGALNTIGATTTGQFAAPRLDLQDSGTARITLTDALNIFLFRPDLDLGATIRLFQQRRLLELLAEPNVLAMDGKPAHFLAGGEFPIPVVQSGVGGAGTVTIQWREFGVRLNFVPIITPRNTIRLQVMPEVSALDFANAVTLSGFTVPAISTRRVQTEIELNSGQSFAIAGLLDNRVTETFSKIPGIGDIPVLGKLFQSRALNKSNTELLVVVTPELVRPIPAGVPTPSVPMPKPFLEGASPVPPRTPGMEVTGPVPVKPPRETVPFEVLQEPAGASSAAPAGQATPVFVLPPAAAPQAPGATPGPPGRAVAPQPG